MAIVRPITPADVLAFKTTRLRALQDTPLAFSSTFEKESKFPDSEWLARVERMNGEKGIGFLALDGEIPCGIVASFLAEKDAARADLVSMWTAPTYRRRGIGQMLVNAVMQWARIRNARTLVLLVASNNESAIRFYEALGFTRTGRTEPYPLDPTAIECEMVCSLGD